ncbi:MAG: response regulator [Rhodospirillales bacterium]|nr:response regulator [Rhodospirillales bacterium]
MAYQLYRITVLVVEDNLPMMEIAKSLLLTFGVGNVVTAHNGEEGLQMYRKHRPDIIIADWMMQPVDGISFTRLVRNDLTGPNRYVPIILMTGFSERRRVIQARDSGVTEFLVKPFTAKDLYRRIVQVIERPRQFVRSEDFFGPDRRRKLEQSYIGPFRREADFMDTKTRKKIESQKKEGAASLKKIRQDAGLSKGDKFDLDLVDRAEGDD